MFWQGLGLGIMIGYAIQKVLSGRFDWEKEIY